MSSQGPSTKYAALDYPVKSVTLFKSDKAEVVRNLRLKLEPGQNKIQIINLSSVIVPDSVRITGLPEGVKVFDLVSLPPQGSLGFGRGQRYDGPAVESRIDELNSQKTLLSSEITTRQTQANILTNYSNTLTSEHIQPEDAVAFVKEYHSQTKAIQQHIAELNKKIRELDSSISALQRGDVDFEARYGRAEFKVNAVISAKSKQVVEARMVYLVTNVQWEPVYELHASVEAETGKPVSSVSLQMRAKITQSTGENWTDARLKLSTVSASETASQIPYVKMRKLQINHGGFRSKPFTTQVQQMQVPHRPIQAMNATSTSLFGNNENKSNANPFGVVSFQDASQNAIAMKQGNADNTSTVPASVFGKPTPFGQQAPAPSNNLFSQPATFGGFSNPAAPQMVSQPQPLFGGGGIFGNTALESSTGPGNLVGNTSTGLSDDFVEVEGDADDGDAKTVVRESSLAVTYPIEGECEIPSDGKPHHVAISTFDFEAKVSHISTKVDTHVYLQCSIKNASDRRLLAGLVNIFLDDTYASRGRIPDTAANHTFTCTLGIDPAVHVSHSHTHATVQGAAHKFGQQEKVTTVKKTTTIHNTHRYPLTALQVREVVPLTDTGSDIKVLLRKPTGLAELHEPKKQLQVNPDVKVGWADDDGEKEGRFVWYADVAANSKTIVKAEWDIACPSNIYWNEVTV